LNARTSRIALILLPCLCLILGLASGWAQLPVDSAQAFRKLQVMVPMRDGVRLNTEIYIPQTVRGPWPFLITRTPYGISHDRNGFSGFLTMSYYRAMSKDGYIMVFQDIRGRHQSEGEFVMLRNPRDRRDPKSIDESTDAYDTIEWLLRNIPDNNGRAGMLGISYGGWLTVMAMLDPHPALKAVSPQASPADMFLGDDFHHNGAFRLSYGFEYVALMETSRTNTNFQFDKYDTFEWYLKLGPLSHVNADYFHGKMPTWNDFVAHPSYDAFWQKQAFAPYLDKVTVPTLNVAGWWDQEDFYGPLEIYDLLEKHDDNHFNHLVVGPWNHGGWAGRDGSRLGNVEFGAPTCKYFQDRVQARWFAHYLRDEGELDLPEALTFETGTNKWVRHDHWPPRQGATSRRLYFHSDGKLSFQEPATEDDKEFDSYLSDPAHPVPYRPRPIEPTYPGPEWPVWLVQDQRFVHLRPDVQTWVTEPLENDVIVAGEAVAHLFASTTGSDSDWIAKLIDVYPEQYAASPKMGGYQLMVANEVFRGRFRTGFDKPRPIEPDQVNEYVFSLHSLDHCFRKGHKIMVQVQSTWFPLIDRNPQKYVDNIFLAKSSDYQSATQRIYRSKGHASHLVLPVEAKE
jgi:uncharacterized protein